MEDDGMLYGHLVHFTNIFVILYGHLVQFVVIWYIFPRFGSLYQEKSGNPAEIAFKLSVTGRVVEKIARICPKTPRMDHY
jgi:Na+/glutamate symporter